MKVAIVLTVVAVLGFSCLAVAQNHNYFFGARKPYDTLLNTTTYITPGAFLRVRTHNLEYPLKGQRGRNITAIYVYDRIGGDRGGYANIVWGGIGKNYTRVHLKSQRGLGMNFQVEIYGQ